MDWNFKSASWDLTEFQEETISKIHGVDGLGSGLGDHRNSGEFSIDLKLGQVGNSSEDNWKQFGASKMASSPSGSSKRARAGSNGSQTVSCLVDGCDSDLSNCREYHRRHKVCEQHSKTAQVTIAGQSQRFCQQCSRFHSLEKFDEGKRSCRKRLDGHNRRRRKPQPEPMSHSGNFLPNYQGTQLLSFSNSQVYPSTSLVNPMWAGVVSTKADSRLYNQHQQLNLLDKQNLFLGSSSGSFKGGKQISSQGDNHCISNNQTSPKTSVCQPLLRTLALPESGRGSHNMFCDRLATQIRDSDCALSLLSSPQTYTSGISLNEMVQPNSIPLAHPLGPNLHDHSLESMDSILVSYGRDANPHCPGNFHMGSDAYSVHDSPQTLPFHWE